MSSFSAEQVTTLQNPFKAQQRRGHEDTLKYCAWEVLKDFPQGLHISKIAKEVQERGLRDLTKMKNAVKTISSELVRSREAFCQVSKERIWCLRAFVPSGLVHEGAALTVATMSPKLDAVSLPKGQTLVGHRVAVWWKGERRFFEGVIENFDPETDTHSVNYDDGDTDTGLKFRKYDVSYKNEKIDVVTVTEHNMDDGDESSSQQKDSPTSKDDASEWSISAGQMSCSMDSTTGAEMSESTPTKRRRQAQARKRGNARKGVMNNQPRSRSSLEAANRVSREFMADANSSRLDHSDEKMLDIKDGLCHLKRKNEPFEDSSMMKKQRTDQGSDASRISERKIDFPYGMHYNSRLEKDLKQGLNVKALSAIPQTPNDPRRADVRVPMESRISAKMYTGIPPRLSYSTMNQMATQRHCPSEDRIGPSQMGHMVPTLPNGALGAGTARSQRVERINVLDLKKQMQPPEDKRPDLKNLTDVGDLMSLSELSNELKLIQDSTVDADEVTSKSTERKVIQGNVQTGSIETPGVVNVSEKRGAHESLSQLVQPIADNVGTQTALRTPSFIGKTLSSVIPRSAPQARHSVTTPREPHCDRRNSEMSFNPWGGRGIRGGRDFLSPSILSSQQDGRVETGATTARLPQYSDTSGSCSRVHPQATLQAMPSGARCHSAKSDMTLNEVSIPEGPAGIKMSIDASSRNNESATATPGGRYEAVPFQPQEPPDQTTSESVKSQWKGGYSVAGV